MNYLPHLETKTKLHRSVSSSNLINKLNNFKSIFSHNKHIDNSILLLKKKEYDIFYSCKKKYPLLVMEPVSILTGKPGPGENKIDRNLIEDPFREDIDIPEKSRHSLDDYLHYMEFGGSMGHNAAAGQHKTNLDIYYETFLLSNITPQNMVLNSGLWVLFETWCKYLGGNVNITNIKIFTGSIPDTKTTNCNGVKINIPIKMFKIVCFNLINNNNNTDNTKTTTGDTYCDIFITNNSAYYINPNTLKFDLTKFLLPKKSHNWFQNFSGIDIKNLLEYYGYNSNSNNIKAFADIKNILPITISLSPALRKLMNKSGWYGFLIYSPTIEHLEKVWEECKKKENEFENLEYHKQFYEATKARLIRDKEQFPDIMLFQSNIKYFTTIYNNMFPNNNNNNNNNKIFKKHTRKQTQSHKKNYINKSLKQNKTNL